MTEPFYSDDLERTCECGCGTTVLRRFVSGHNRRGRVTSGEHRAKIGAAQKIAWATKRKRKPLGSTRLDANGYRLVKVREHGGRWDKQHILVVESAIGRRLRPGEEVHHINGRKTDNRLENLQLCASSSEHQTIERSFNRLLGDLLDSGHVVYDTETKVYRIG